MRKARVVQDLSAVDLILKKKSKNVCQTNLSQDHKKPFKL
jgi:hypothetical protein